MTSFGRSMKRPLPKKKKKEGRTEGSQFCKCSQSQISGVEKLTRSSLKGFLNRALFAFKNGRFAGSFLFLGIGLLKALKKANLSFKSPSPKPHLNRTGSVFALPKISCCISQACVQWAGPI